MARQLWITARMTHCFALGVLLGRPGSAELADHGLRHLPDGPDAYAHAFVVLAAASAAVAGRPGAAERLAGALGHAERRFWREDEGAVVDDPGEAYRGANANMHTVEAFLAAADATGDPRLGGPRAADRDAARSTRAARADDWRVPEHFDAAWTPLPDYNADAPRHPFRPYGVTPGHGLEWARLLLHLRAALGDPPAWLEPAARGARRPRVGGRLGRGARRLRVHDRPRRAPGRGRPVPLGRLRGDRHRGGPRRRGAGADGARRSPSATSSTASAAAGGTSSTRRTGPRRATWQGKPDVYHALQAMLLPGLPAAAERRRARSRGRAALATGRRRLVGPVAVGGEEVARGLLFLRAHGRRPHRRGRAS